MIEKIKNYIFPLLLLISIGIFKNTFLYTIFWLIILTLFIIINGFAKDNSYIKGSIIRVSIISILIYFVVTYMMGLILGFNKTPYNLSLISILKNISVPFVVILCQELIRFIYAKRCLYNIKPYILLTIIYIVLNIVIEISEYSFNGTESIFLFISINVIPIIAFQMLYSYITFKISFIPSLIIRLIFGLNTFVLPIFPNLGNYLYSIISILYPFITFVYIERVIKMNSKEKEKRTSKFSFGKIVIFGLLFIIVILVSGIFKYQLVAIGSGSMEPVIYRGDAVLLEKRNDYNNMLVGEVLAFKKNNVLITHRIVGIEKKNKHYIFKTKGDNNKDVDSYNILEEDIVGTVAFKISYAGYPTIWINEQIKGR